MNILISLTPSSPPQVEGFCRVMEDLGLTIYTWNPQFQTIYEVVDKVKIDYFFCESQYISPLVLEAITEYKIPTITFGLTEPFAEQLLVCLLTDLPDKIKQNIQKPYYILHPAANIIKDIPYLPPFDVLYIDEPHNEENLEYIKYLIQNNIQVKITGSTRLDLPQYVGYTNILWRLALCKAAKIVVVNDEIYKNDISIVQSLFFKCKIKEIFTNMKFFTNAEVLEGIEHFLTDEKHRSILIKEAYQNAKQNTYYHRAHDIFNQLGLTEVAQQCLKALE